jgi:hypothetical protein
MAKKPFTVGDYTITQLNRTAYEAENPAEELDFYFDAKNAQEVQVIVFDSLREATEEQDAYLGVVLAASLEEAVKDAMQLTKNNLQYSLMWR